VARDEGRGRALLATVRQASGAGSVELLMADLSNLRSVRALVKLFGGSHDRLDVLVHTAAVFKRRRIETADGFELMFATNFLGPFLLTNLVVPALRAGAPSRVITVAAPTTTELDFDDLQIKANWRPLHAFVHELAAPARFVVGLASRSPDQAAQAVAYLASSRSSKESRVASSRARRFRNRTSTRTIPTFKTDSGRRPSDSLENRFPSGLTWARG